MSESSRAQPRDPGEKRRGDATGSLGFARDDTGDGKSTRVPLFGTWRNAYVVVIVAFVVDVALFYAVSRIFA